MDERTDRFDGARKSANQPYATWPEVDELIRSGAYDQLRRILEQYQEAGINAGDSTWAAVLDAVQQLCHTCSEMHREQDEHHQAIHRIELLEQDTQRRIECLLEPLWVAPTTDPGSATPDTTTLSPPTWGQSLRRWIARTFGLPRMPIPSENRTVAEEPVVVEAPSDVEPPPQAEPLPAPLVAEPAEELVVTSPSGFNIYCLGTFRVYYDDALITNWPSRKGRSILQFMLLNRASPVSKDLLMETFWPGGDPADTRRNLHQAIYSLRQSLRQYQPDLQPILFNRDSYSLNPDIPFWVDFEEFAQHSHQGQQFEAANQLDKAIQEYGIAVSFYQGDFMEEDLYEDWPTTPRDNLRNLFIAVANRLGKYYWEHSEITAAIALSQVILTRDNCNEEAHRRLMRCYSAMGQRHLAIRQYQSCMQALKVELELAPSQATIDLFRQLAG